MADKNAPATESNETKKVLIRSSLNYPLTLTRSLKNADGTQKAGLRNVTLAPKNVSANGLPAGVTEVDQSFWRDVSALNAVKNRMGKTLFVEH